MTVEDRYGKIITFDKNGKITDDPKNILYSSYYSLNIFSSSIESFISFLIVKKIKMLKKLHY